MNSLNNILPRYSIKEEQFNMISHLFGIIIGIAVIATALCEEKGYLLICKLIFGISLILLYSVSSTYHGLTKKNIRVKKIFQIIDHCMIYVLVAGSCTPFALCVLGKYDMKTGWILYAVIWTLAVIGIILNLIDLNKFRHISMVLYFFIGLLLFIKADVIFTSIGYAGVILFLTGGLMYSIGTAFYIKGKNLQWMHSIFHLFCILGSVLHTICIMNYVD